MNINEIQPNFELINNTGSSKIQRNHSESLEIINDFSQLMKTQLNDTNEAARYSDMMQQKLVLGEVSNVHDVMIAGQKASMALDFTMTVRNLLLDAYNKLTMLR